MRVKIQKSMLLVLCITLLTTFSLLIAATYFQSLNNMKAELKQEAVYIQTAINISGTKYLEDMDAAQVKTRLTVIDENGTVLYDSKEDDFTFENHKERKEVKDAFANGWGEDLRKSNTLGEQTYYYALTLNDGNILRVAKTVDNVQPAIMDMLPYMAVIAVGMFCFAYFLAKWQTSRLIRPINNLNLEEPLENNVYEELKPLLLSIDKQNKEKEAVANMRKEFSANVSHELKTPLTSIINYVDLLKRENIENEKAKDYIRVLDEKSQRLKQLTEDLVEASKISSGNIKLEFMNLNLNELVQQVNGEFAERFEGRNLDLICILQPEPLLIRADSRRIWRVLENLYVNVCKYAMPGTRVYVDAIKKDLEGKITLFSGHSGVGKSTLINAILPGTKVKTGEISTYHNKGMHTTTFSEMFSVDGDGYIIDTPGIKGFGTFDMEEEEIGHYFPEIFKVSADCKYGNCTHRHEPGCAVREAVEKHLISESRYTSYLNMLEDKEEGKYRAAY
mgnify:CR=1 FL=1